MDGDVDVDDILQSPTGELGRVLVLNGVAALCKLTMLFMNRTTVKNEPALQIITDRPEDQALITVSNHTSTVDDPCIPCALLPQAFYLREANHQKTRWVYCAEEICFSNPASAAFFRSGKVLPIKRGAGLDQPNLQVMAQRLGTHGEWLHVFPEGRISYDGKLSDLRWGVGKMVCDVMKYSGGKPPIVLPYYHSGMGDVMPYKARVPHFGHNITVTLGDPLDLSDLTCDCHCQGVEQERVWEGITQRIRAALLDLEMRTVSNADQTKVGAAPGRHVRSHGGKPATDTSAGGVNSSDRRGL